MFLAVIIPIYNESEFISENLGNIFDSMESQNIECKYILVDDGSTDGSWQEIKRTASGRKNVTAIRFARHFGKEMAICAGLDNIKADRYLIMDSDLQHPPSCVKSMLQLMDSEAADIVEGIKKDRGIEPLWYRIGTKIFYIILQLLTGMRLEHSSDFKIIKNNVADSIRNFSESGPFFRGIVDWVGFKKVSFPFRVDPRSVGRSRFSLRILIKTSLNAVLSHTNKPLYMILACGMAFFVSFLALAVKNLSCYLGLGTVSEFSVVALLILLCSSMIMLSMGVLGLYVSRIYNEVKRRPRYILSDRVNASE